MINYLMKKDILLISSLTISILGIFILLFIANFNEPKTTNIKDLNDMSLNTNVKIQGNITSIINYQKLQKLIINDSTGKIDIILDKKIQGLNKSKEITVYGKLSVHNNKQEIIASKLILNG